MILTDDQRMLQDTVRPFMAEEGAGRLLEHPLVVGEKAHAPGSPRMCLATMLS